MPNKNLTPLKKSLTELQKDINTLKTTYDIIPITCNTIDNHFIALSVELEKLTETKYMTKKDIEVIERMIYKNTDDIAISVARSFERLQDRIDAQEQRIAELEDKLEKLTETK